MNGYEIHWVSKIRSDASTVIELLYKDSVSGKRNSRQIKTRIEEELKTLEENSTLANRFLTSVYYMRYINEIIYGRWIAIPWNEPLLSSEIAAGILNYRFSPFCCGLNFIGRDFNQLTLFPEPEDHPELIVLTSESSMSDIIELTETYAETDSAGFSGLKGTEQFDFYVRIIPVSEESISMLSCFPKRYRKSILNRMPGMDMGRIPNEVDRLFPFITGKVRLDVGDVACPSFSFCVDNLYNNLNYEYGDVSRVFAFAFANYIYCCVLSDESDNNSSKRKDLAKNS